MNRRTAAAAVAVPALIAAIWAALLGQNVLRYEGAYSTDSVFYVDAARWIAGGHGPLSGIATAAESVRDGALPPRPLRMWPPGYPYLVAAVMALGYEAPHAALIAVQLGLFVLLAAAALLGYALAGANGAAIALAACALHAPLRHAASHAWSEVPAMALLLLAFALSAFALRDRRPAFAALAGLLAASALTVRYALAPASAVMIAAYFLPKPGRPALRLAAAHTGAFGAALAAVWALTGWRPGGAGPRPRAEWLHPLPELGLLAEEIAAALRPASALAAALIVLLAGAAILARYRRFPGQSAQAYAAAAALGLWLPLYGAALLYGAMRYHLDPIDARLALPLTLPLAIGLAVILAYAGRLHRLLPAGAACLLLAAAALDEARALAPVLQIPPPRPYDAERRIANSETLLWLRDNLAPSDRVMIVDGLDVPFLLGPQPTVVSIGGDPGAPANAPTAFAELLRRQPAEGRFLLVLRGRFDPNAPLPVPAILAETVPAAPERRFYDGAVLERRPR